MAKFKPAPKAKQQKQLQQAAASDSEDYSGDLSDDGDEMLPGSDSGSDDGVDYDDVAAAAAVVGGRSKKQPAVRDIAALAAAAQQQAADYAARQKKALAAAGGVPLAAAADEEEEEGEEESGSEDMDDAGGGSSEEGDDAAAGKRPHIYNADALHEKLEDIAWIDEQPWRESLVVTSGQPTQVDDVDDDLQRELAFYNQAMSATSEAITRFQSEGVAWLRPPDYYAEMVKSDEQMARIKDRLMYEQQQIDQAAERRKAREQKAYAKQVQAEKQKERTQEKKRQIQQVQQLRKQREKSGFAGELDFDAEMNKQGSGGGGRGGQQQQQQRGKQAGQRFNPNDRTPGKKRQLKNAKFGFGGKKKLQKQNDAFSAADMSGFKGGRFDDGPRRGGGGGGFKKGGGGGKGGRPGGPIKGGVNKKKGGGAGGGGGNRPGKARRQQQRQRKL